MSLQRLKIDGYGQIELNNVVFRRDGRIEAQCKLDATDFSEVPAENGMILAINNAKRTIELPKEDNELPLGLNYTTEHFYNTTDALKDFKLNATDDFLPRLGIITVGEKFTTNCITYDTSDYSDDTTLKAAIEKTATARVYGTYCTNGAIKVTKTKPANGCVLIVTKAPGMPDGQYGVQFQVASI